MLSADFLLLLLLLLLLLMINCVSKPGLGFAPYVEYFGLLKHVRVGTEDNVDEMLAKFFQPFARMDHQSRLAAWNGNPPTLPA
ncbi:hypothetical protein [Variovorax fucosicus]|uniref:hypothetical protein n=1 Tax=Variovorax fucosicus TaxID=3053517 RepID=UPI0033658527